MHQPEYRDLPSGEYRLPWTYLHAIKDYVDMAAHIEATPGARAVVNFGPVLLEQIDDYANRVGGFLREGTPIPDGLLSALVAERFDPEPDARRALVAAAQRANEQRLIARFSPYRDLCELAHFVEARSWEVSYLNDQFLADLLVWYHLAWLGETVRRSDLRVKRLMEKGHRFSLEDRRTLLGVIGELLASVIPRYRALHYGKQIELSLSPYAHPIVPLLLDLGSARESMPTAELPESAPYPDGQESARWHIATGIETFERYFGFVPKGCWPSEGGLSEATLALLGEYGFEWAATGESVLRNSVNAEGAQFDLSVPHRLFRIADGATRCVFRSDELSDDIGFNFAHWHADDAAGHLVHRLEAILDSCRAPAERVVSIILDGENAWEFYPENGYHFLSALYNQILDNPRLELTTFSECIEARLPERRLSGLVAGSWVYGTFSTWIGEAHKNRGWAMLIDAKRAFDRALREQRLSAETLVLARRQLMVCEGSDWFWWLGDVNPAHSVNQFDRLFRAHLANLYALLGDSPPQYLSEAISTGGGAAEAGGVMRRGSEPLRPDH